MRGRVEDEHDVKELEELGAEPWMVELLALCPDYVGWGPHEDYMWCREDAGWRSPIIVQDWSKFDLQLDGLNEVVNFYFAVDKPWKECEACGRTGLNPATKAIEDDFYGFRDPKDRWCDKITQDEVDMLVEEGRLFDLYPSHEDWVKAQAGEIPRPHFTAEQVNAHQHRGALCGHDAINRWALVRHRAKRLGVYGLCEYCNGHGKVATGPVRVSLVLWLLHPRKGASRGVEVENITQADLPAVFAFLKEAADRNQERFAAVVAKAGA